MKITAFIVSSGILMAVFFIGCKKKSVICDPGDPVVYGLPVNFVDANGHDLLYGIDKKYDTSVIKIYFNNAGTRFNVGVALDSSRAKQVGYNYIVGLYGFQYTYYVEIKGTVTDSIAFTYTNHESPCTGMTQEVQSITLNSNKVNISNSKIVTVVK